ncbi:MAG: VWA domain-containing protein [Coriobacteriia bacterium]|nr:VWA domain-containing protein [Coriobacteriia bacterium]
MAQRKQPKKEPAKKPEDRSILINFVLDKSGSMSAIEDATISGFNEFKGAQADEEGDAFFTLTVFDSRSYTVCEAVPLREVPDLDRANYRPGGCTALFDAIGETMRITDDFVAANHPDQVLFVIMTDGMENASQEFTSQMVFDLIRARQDVADYEFMYLGANQDSYAAGESMGLRKGRTLDYAHSSAGASEGISRASCNVSAYRRHGDKKRDAFFSSDMELLGRIEARKWREMSPEERQRHLEGEGGPQA